MLPSILLCVQLAIAEGPMIPVDTLRLLPDSPVPADSVWLPMRAPPSAERAVSLGEAYTGWSVERFGVHGVTGDLRAQLRDGLALSGQSRWLVLRRWPAFSPSLLADDLDRARLFLARNGHPWAVVTARFTPRAEKRAVAVDFDIVAGPGLRVAANRTEAVPPALQPRADRLLRLRRDEVFSDSRVEMRISRLLSLLQEDGRARANVTTRLTLLDSTHVEVLFLVQAGSVFHFGDVRVEGASPNLRTTVRRTVDIENQQRYSPSKLRRAEEGLRSLDLFRKVEVTTVEAGEDRLDVVAQLAERTPRTLGLGIGWYTDDQAQVRTEWKHRNLFGGGRGASLNASYSRFVQEAGVTVWKPILFHSRTRGSLGVRGRREAEELYTLRSVEFQAAATYLQSARTTIQPAITISRIDIETALPIDSVFDSPPHSLMTAGLRWTHSALDNALDPRRGTYAWAYTEYGLPDFGLENQYALVETEGSVFRPVGERLLIAGRGHVGLAFPVGSSLALLPNKRFYGGGASSMRGYRRHKLGPLDTAFRPIGGVALFESSLEFRFPLFGALQGAVFTDAGQVWERRADVPDRLAVAVGPGLLLHTPIGLARFDVGVLVTDPGPDQPRRVFQLQVGHGF